MMKKPSEIIYLPEFDRDLKKLVKKYKTLEDDLRIFKKNQLYLFHKEGIDNKGTVQISNLGIDNPKIYKVRKFACRSLKGKGISYSTVSKAAGVIEKEIETKKQLKKKWKSFIHNSRADPSCRVTPFCFK